MALYRGTIQVSGGGSGGGGNFNPENQGSVGQILTKTATGYDWETGSGGPTYTAGANITIDANNEISAIDTTYSAGANITIDANNEISATDTTYVAGDFDIKDLADTTGLRTTWSGKADASDVNTKTFYLSSASDLTNAQAAYDWFLAGKAPIIMYNNTEYTIDNLSGNAITFTSIGWDTINVGNSYTRIRRPQILLFISSSSVTSIMADSFSFADFLSTSPNYSTPYTPQYNGSPATKKYVDDSLSAKISTGTTAPSNPTEGQLWYDSTNDVLKVYDGTQWNSVGGGGGGGSYTAGANIDITNDVISAENVIVTDAVNSTGFKIEDNNDNFTDVGLSNVYEIKVGNEQDDQQGNYDYTDVDLIGNTGTIGGRNYHETPSIEDHREYYITPEGIEATREITSGGTTTTTTENYYWIDDGLGNTDDKIAKLGDIVTYTAGTNISIDANNEISATDTTYSAGTGLTLSGTTFNVDTTTIATKADLANFAGFEVVATLPQNPDTNMIYLKGPIGTGTDKYEEWIYSNSTWIQIGETSIDLTNYLNTSTQTSDAITEGSTNLFLTSAERTVLGNTSGVNTGDQSASDFDIKDLADSTSLRTTWSGKQDAFFTSSSTAPANPSEGDAWYDTTNDIFKTYDGTSWNVTSNFPGMTILSYGHSTWQDFIDAYNENAIVYCRASSNSNPGSGVQGRMAFMAFIDINSSTQAIQGVEFQYYRSRSSHSTAANVLDEVYVYKLTPASGGTWTVTQRDTAAKPIAGTGIGLTYNTSGMTIANTAPFDPGTGTTGQVLTKTASGYEWSNPTVPITDASSGGDIYRVFRIDSSSDTAAAQAVSDYHHNTASGGLKFFVRSADSILTLKSRSATSMTLSGFHNNGQFTSIRTVTINYDSDGITVTSVSVGDAPLAVSQINSSGGYPTGMALGTIAIDSNDRKLKVLTMNGRKEIVTQ